MLRATAALHGDRPLLLGCCMKPPMSNSVSPLRAQSTGEKKITEGQTYTPPIDCSLSPVRGEERRRKCWCEPKDALLVDVDNKNAHCR